MAPRTHFPLKTALAIATFVVILAAYRHFQPTDGISPAIFPQAAHISLWRHPPAPTVPIPPPQQGGELNHIQQVNAAPGAREPISAFLIDDSGALDPFFAALHRLETNRQTVPPEVVTVLHYGDSPTTADLITGQVRTLLQQRFGDAGRGYLLTGKPWAWYGHDGVDLADHDWTISTAVGKGHEEVYGLGGASFTGDSGAGSHITLKVPDQTDITVSFLAQPGGGTVQLMADGRQIALIDTGGSTSAPDWQDEALPFGTKVIDLKAEGKVELFGEDLRTGRPGVLYDSLGLNGASTSVLSTGFNASAWAAELQHTQPNLVVINYGTNESGFGAYVDKQYEPTLRTSIARIRAALPDVPVLVMSPMDRGRRAGVDEIETYDTIPRLVAIQRRVAAELHCAFFDTFDAMGGQGTMARWYTGHPRLVAGDLIHPTPQGASIVAELFVKDLSVGYDQYMRRTAAQPTPTEKTAAPVAPEKTP